MVMMGDLGGTLFRFKREEAKIQAWENHEKAKAEAEMRRIEVTISLTPPYLIDDVVFRLIFEVLQTG